MKYSVANRDIFSKFVTFQLANAQLFHKEHQFNATTVFSVCRLNCGALGCTSQGKIPHIHRTAWTRGKRWAKSLSPYFGKASVYDSGIATLINKVWKYAPEQGRYTVIQLLIATLEIKLDKSFCHSLLCFHIFM